MCETAQQAVGSVALLFFEALPCHTLFYSLSSAHLFSFALSLPRYKQTPRRLLHNTKTGTPAASCWEWEERETRAEKGGGVGEEGVRRLHPTPPDLCTMKDYRDPLTLAESSHEEIAAAFQDLLDYVSILEDEGGEDKLMRSTSSAAATRQQEIDAGVAEAQRADAAKVLSLEQEIVALHGELEVSERRLKAAQAEMGVDHQSQSREAEERMLAQLREFQKQVEEANASIAEKDATILAKEDEIVQAHADGLAEGSSKMAAKEKLIKELQDEEEAQAASEEALKETITNQKEALAQMEVKLTEAHTRVHELEVEVGTDKVGAAVRDVRQQLADTEAQLGESEREKALVKEEVEKALRQRDETAARLGTAESTISKLEIAIGQNNTDNATLVEKLQSRQKELDLREQQRKELIHQQNESSTDLQAKIDEKVEQIVRLNNEVQYERSRNETLMGELDDYKDQLLEAEANYLQMKGNFDTIRQNHEKRETSKNEEVVVMREEMRLIRQEYSVKVRCSLKPAFTLRLYTYTRTHTHTQQADSLRAIATQAEEQAREAGTQVLFLYLLLLLFFFWGGSAASPPALHPPPSTSLTVRGACRRAHRRRRQAHAAAAGAGRAAEDGDKGVRQRAGAGRRAGTEAEGAAGRARGGGGGAVRRAGGAEGEAAGHRGPGARRHQPPRAGAVRRQPSA